MNSGVNPDTLDPRRKRARYRSWHRGTREMDLILGPFADAEVAGLTPDELGQYEAVLDQPDPDLYKWITGEREAPPELAAGLFQRIRASARS